MREGAPRTSNGYFHSSIEKNEERQDIKNFDTSQLLEKAIASVVSILLIADRLTDLDKTIYSLSALGTRLIKKSTFERTEAKDSCRNDDVKGSNTK